jgi:hypothetical protein
MALPEPRTPPAGPPTARSAVPPDEEPLHVGCDDCSRRHSPHCADCLVTFLCREDDGSVVVSLDELRLVRRLQAGGLAPPLRHRHDGSRARHPSRRPRPA